MRIFMVLAILPACQVTTTDDFTNPPPGPPDTCTVIASLDGCDQGSISYACKSDRPDGSDPNLVCSNGTPGAPGTTLYCCAPYAQDASECAPDTTIPGCGSIAIGFRCTGAVSPSDADPTIACSSATTGEFCCNTAAPIATCAVDPTVGCAGIDVGYSCTGADMPLPTGFTCVAQPASAPDQTSYCCAPS